MRAGGIDERQVLQPDEVAQVLAHLRERAANGPEAFSRLVVFVLSCCCGLRAHEIAALELRDVRTETRRPYLALRVAKGGRPRRVPLTWDAASLEDLRRWRELRESWGAKPSDPFLCQVRKSKRGRPLDRHSVARRWKTAVGILGDRAQELPCHSGRHTFVSAALAQGVAQVQVMRAAGHQSLTTTSRYAHCWGRSSRASDLFDPQTLEALT